LARDRTLKVDIPKPEQDRPELGRVGVIAAVGFAIGVAWPWLAGVHLVPSPPTDEVLETVGGASAVPSSGPAPPSEAPSAALSVTAPERTTAETVKISTLQISGCRDGKKKLKDCDRLGVDERLRGHLGVLASCDAARGATDTLSVGFELDLVQKAVVEVFPGKSTTFPKDKAHELIECARAELTGVKLDGLDHDHERYTVFYFVEFTPPGSAVVAGSAPAIEETAEASGLATVGWDVAVVRDQPDDGKILTRLRFGTRVAVTSRRGKWYEVKYDAKGDKGWVHRNALGM
jgi:Bacterial SH3 domain